MKHLFGTRSFLRFWGYNNKPGNSYRVSLCSVGEKTRGKLSVTTSVANHQLEKSRAQEIELCSPDLNSILPTHELCVFELFILLTLVPSIIKGVFKKQCLPQSIVMRIKWINTCEALQIVPGT